MLLPSSLPQCNLSYRQVNFYFLQNAKTIFESWFGKPFEVIHYVQDANPLDEEYGGEDAKLVDTDYLNPSEPNR